MYATYLRLDIFKAANAALIEHQADIELAQLGPAGTSPASTACASSSRRDDQLLARPPLLRPRRGATWLNMVNDQAAGLAGKVVAGPRATRSTCSLRGLLTLAGYAYAPQLADLPDQKLWRIDTRADHGPVTTAAGGRIDLDRVRRHWDDILRVIASVHTGAVRSHHVIQMLSRDGHPTPLGEAIATTA